jgi:hypothetical protein
MKIRTLYSDKAGPRVTYAAGLLRVEDLNPEVRTCWRMSPGELFVFGFRCIVAAFAARFS